MSHLDSGHLHLQHGQGVVGAVADCAAPQKTGTIPSRSRCVQMPIKQNIDSGFVSGLLSPCDLHSPATTRDNLRFPKEAHGHGVDEQLNVDFGGLRLEELKTAQMSEEEQTAWDQRYLRVLDEAFGGDDDGDTHLHLATIYGFYPIAVCLVRLVPHADFLNLRNSYLQTALHLAALTGQSSLCRHLVVAGADTTLRDRHGNTPLHLACERADLACVHALTAPVSVRESREAALKYDSPPVAPPPVEYWNYQGLTCLHLATLAGNLQLVAHLVSFGASVSSGEGKSGRAPVHLAVEAGNISLLRFLIEACGAEVDAVTYSGLTGYQLALLNARLDVADLLEQLGADRRELPDSDLEMSDSDDSEIFMKTEDLFCDLRIRGKPVLPAP